jgi:5-methylcytosine-specific restriction endonuclease McrA
MRKIAKKKIPLSKLKTLRFEVLLKRDGNRCVRCGRTTGLSPAHIYPTGRYPRMAWMLENIIVLCWFGCHDGWWHKNPLEAAEWYKKTYPENYKKLKALSQQDLPPLDHVKIKEYLEKELEKWR